METIGTKIKRIRRANNLSLMQLAKTLNVSDMTLYKIETGKTKSITIEIGTGIAKALGVPFNELFEIEIGNLPKEEGLIQIEDLKGKLEELKERISEKDQLIRAITNQNRQLKYEFLSMLHADYQREIDEMLNEIKDSTDEEQKQILTENIEAWRWGLDDVIKSSISCGIIDKNDIDEFNEIIKNEMKRDTLNRYHKDIQFL